jgi:hypothetical protein
MNVSMVLSLHLELFLFLLQQPFFGRPIVLHVKIMRFICFGISRVIKRENLLPFSGQNNPALSFRHLCSHSESKGIVTDRDFSGH